MKDPESEGTVIITPIKRSLGKAAQDGLSGALVSFYDPEWAERDFQDPMEQVWVRVTVEIVRKGERPEGEIEMKSVGNVPAEISTAYLDGIQERWKAVDTIGKADQEGCDIK
jgi:hypothetical protein